MANRTDPLAKSIRGTNPQNLVEKILRTKIYQNTYWKEQCFGLTAETLVDKAMEIDHLGGTHGGNRKPTPFMCLVMKMLQIQPDKEIVVEFIKNPEYKYVRALGAFYLRLTGTDVDVYRYLEPLYNDYRKLRLKLNDGKFTLTHVDEFIDELLTTDYSCDIALPRIRKRLTLEAIDSLEPRRSALEDDFEEEEEKDEDDQLADGLDSGSHEDYYGARSPTKERGRDRRRDNHRYRDRDYDRERDYDKVYDRDRGRGRDRDGERDRERERDRDRHRARDEKDYGRERDREREREREGRERERRDRERGGGEAIQGAEVEVEIARTGMVMTVAKGLVAVLVLKGVGGGLRMHEPSRERRKRRQIKMTEQIIRILRLQNKIGSGHLLD
ncbi:UNVERIFIED_CONTAM: Pre-splicing factor 38 [Sesamum calycinum]|uniref:Pre-mRNA-splicing factor 38 n=1 Tax=Sesamum calycinum TaxID=2727403 RepID=A0AAW2R7B8_9LAMI